MPETIAVAVSGGIDSLAASYLLQSEGHSVFGIHFLSGYPASSVAPGDLPAWLYPDQPKPDIISRINGGEGLWDLATQLNMPVYVVDFQADFQHQVVDYFLNSYAMGNTPNPCLVCNPHIKFGKLLETAISLGAKKLATGHYARILKQDDGSHGLFKGADTKKDQSYFLAMLNQRQLASALFPLGDMIKDDIRSLMETNGLVPPVASESQDICFVDQKRYTDFLTAHGVKSKPGKIVTTSGDVIGSHDGLHRYTIGQRRGINCPAPYPYYVIDLDVSRNELIVGYDDMLTTRSCHVDQASLLVPRNEIPENIHARIRYRHHEVPATISFTGDTAFHLMFETPQRAITPGQFAVIYHENRILGGGVIQRSGTC